jgi:hypothetical protein
VNADLKQGVSMRKILLLALIGLLLALLALFFLFTPAAHASGDSSLYTESITAGYCYIL